MSARCRVWAAVATAGLGFLGCSYIEGECWLRSEDEAGAGAGAGPVVPGAGGYGSVPPDPDDVDPQAAADPPLGCGNGEGACHDKCLVDYEEKGAACDEHGDEVQRDKCREEAHSWYKSCRDQCQQKSCQDMYDRCQEIGGKCTTGYPGCDVYGQTSCARCLAACKAGTQYPPECRCRSCGFTE